MAVYFGSSVLSSIRIEPVYTDDYIRNLVGQLTAYHKQKFLKYIHNEPSILNSKHFQLVFVKKKIFFA